MPYNIDKKVGGDSPENVKKVENCVKDIKGKNKRTGKPYTESEKIAICKKILSKSKSAEDAASEIVDATYTATQVLFKSNVTRTLEEAVAMTDAMLARADYEPKTLERLVSIKIGG